MRILWLSNSPCSSIERYGGKTILGGWLASLEKEVVKHHDIQLSIAYLSNVEEEPFTHNGVDYYPIFIGITSKFKTWRTIIQSRQSIESKERNAIPRIIKVSKSVKPDIIHVHGTEELWGKISEFVTDIPIVYSIQGLIAPIKEKLFTGIKRQNAKKHDGVIDYLLCSDTESSYRSCTYRAAREIRYLQKADYIFGRTSWDENCTLALNPRRKYYVVNEILRNEFFQREWSFRPYENRKVKIVSTIGGGIYKGMETALHTAHILYTYSQIDFEWHIIGYKEDSKWCKVAQSEKMLKIRDYPFVFHGRLDAVELSNALLESDIYVHVSHIENSPNSVGEAMLVGLPVIASFAGGTSSILRDGVDGILVQDGDPYVLAGSIVNLLNHPELALRYSENAKESARRRYCPKHVYQELLEGYNQIMVDYYIK